MRSERSADIDNEKPATYHPKELPTRRAACERHVDAARGIPCPGGAHTIPLPRPQPPAPDQTVLLCRERTRPRRRTRGHGGARAGGDEGGGARPDDAWWWWRHVSAGRRSFFTSALPQRLSVTRRLICLSARVWTGAQRRRAATTTKHRRAAPPPPSSPPARAPPWARRVERGVGHRVCSSRRRPLHLCACSLCRRSPRTLQ